MESLAYAAKNNIWIINASFHYVDENGDPAPMSEYHLAALQNYEGLLICAAGNDSINTDNSHQYPAGYGDSTLFDVNNVISVGSIDQQGNISSFSNYGSSSVHIFAPGTSIYSTLPNNSYGYKSGTSMATPFVTGVAALMYSMCLSYSYDPYSTYYMSQGDIMVDIKNRILSSVTKDNKYDGKCVSGGRLNADNAVRSMSLLTYDILEDNTLSITGIPFHFYGGDFIIPDQIDGRYVTEIAPFAFELETSIKFISIPANVKIIGNHAFENCCSLNSVAFAQSYLIEGSNKREYGLKYLGDYAFWNCYNLKIFDFPNSLEYIGNHAFRLCSALQLVNLSECDNLTNINYATFKSCTNLIGVTLADSIKIIGDNAFDGCTKMSYIEARNISNLQGIGNSAFENCKISRFIIPNADITIYPNAFKGCEDLTIFTPLEYQPSGWQSGWNCSNRPVVFGCEFDSNLETVLSFTKSATNPTNQNAVNGINNPNCTGRIFEGWYTNADFTGTKYTNIESAPNGKLYAKWKDSCVAEGSLITLADGTQKAVEELTGDEMLLVWNLQTGSFDIAPILFIDRDGRQEYEVINLTFSDGTTVKVISEHAFWDCDLNKYVFLRNDAHKYIGHYFNKRNGDGWTTVRLMSVDITTEVTSAYSPVSYGHLCYYVNGMLSMPGATEGLINIFDVDPETMKIDEAAFEQDIETYGLFTYEEFAEILPVPEQVFEAFNGKYLKVAIGKGLITVKELALLIQRYSVFFE